MNKVFARAVILSLLLIGIIGVVAAKRSVEKKSQTPVLASPISETEKNKSLSAEEGTDREFDWKVIETMIRSGVSSNDTFRVQEVQLQYVQMSNSKLFFVINTQVLGSTGVLVLYYPQAKILDHNPEHLKSSLESNQYTARSTKELLILASEVVPLLYGCLPVEHKLVTESDGVGSGHLPVTKDTIIPHFGSHGGLFVNYYATLGPWKDTVNVTLCCTVSISGSTT